jgi:hypothetical protein
MTVRERCSVIAERNAECVTVGHPEQFLHQFSRTAAEQHERHPHGGGAMGRVHVRAHGAVPPEQFVAALTDFGSGRAEIWGASDPSHFTVHDRGDTWAEVTEGSAAGGVWQRLRYDWSVPDVVTLDVLDSNAFGPGSRWTYRVESDGAGGCHVDLTIVRVPTTTKGRVFDALLSLGGGGYFARDLRRSLRRLESPSRTPS